MRILRKIAQLFSAPAKELPASHEPERVAEAEHEVVEGKADLAAVVKGNGAFALDLYSRLSSCSGNLFFSPFSISSALAMAYGGAQSATAEEMATALRLPFGQERLHPTFADLLRQVKGKARGLELNLANGLWSQRGCEFRESFVDLVKTHYDADLRELDFSIAAAEACRIINEWVERQTHGKIRDLIGPGALGPLTRLVLANAIYFKGDWASPFEKDRTKDAPFTVTPKQKVTVSMMCQLAEYGYLETGGFQALSLAYEGQDLAMVVFLPRKVEGLPELEKSLTPEKLRTWLARLRPRSVDTYLPRFRATSAFTLNEVLAEMGMRLAFDASAADFSGMTSSERFFLSLILHKAYVDADEKGTEAAAVTVMIAPTCARWHLPQIERIPVFRADHPFLFLIWDRRSGGILFLGRVTNPKE
jgi:serpin B